MSDSGAQTGPQGSAPAVDSEGVDTEQLMRFLVIAGELVIACERFTELAEVAIPKLKARIAYLRDNKPSA